MAELLGTYGVRVTGQAVANWISDQGWALRRDNLAAIQRFIAEHQTASPAQPASNAAESPASYDASSRQAMETLAHIQARIAQLTSAEGFGLEHRDLLLEQLEGMLGIMSTAIRAQRVLLEEMRQWRVPNTIED